MRGIIKFSSANNALNTDTIVGLLKSGKWEAWDLANGMERIQIEKPEFLDTIENDWNTIAYGDKSDLKRYFFIQKNHFRGFVTKKIETAVHGIRIFHDHPEELKNICEEIISLLMDFFKQNIDFEEIKFKEDGKVIVAIKGIVISGSHEKAMFAKKQKEVEIKVSKSLIAAGCLLIAISAFFHVFLKTTSDQAQFGGWVLALCDNIYPALTIAGVTLQLHVKYFKNKVLSQVGHISWE